MSGSTERQDEAGALDGQGVQVGDHNTQVNLFGPYIDRRREADADAGPVVVGDVPQAPAAFQPRAELMSAMERRPGERVSVVFAVTGVRGVGKTQVAAAYARRRINEGWRLVAWVDASDEPSVVAGLARVAVAAGIGSAQEDARVLAGRVRNWLEGDGERRLVVFDNAVDLDMLRPFVPAAGTARVVITSSRRSTAGLGTPVPVDVFSEGEGLGFLAERTGLDDVAGARELGEELGWLPLGLAQAAALVDREHLGYRTYLGRLRALPVADYLRRPEGEAYPYRLAEAVVLSLRAAEAADSSGVRGRLMELVAVLAESGVPRRALHLAASEGMLGDGEAGTAEVDAGLGALADASLVGFTVDDSVLTHRLVMRVARERLATEGRLPAVLAGAVRLLEVVTDGIGEAWRDVAGVRELAGQVSAVAAHAARQQDGEGVPAGLLRLRLRSACLLNDLGDKAGLEIAATERLAADCARELGDDHPDTLRSRSNIARAYHFAGRIPEAIPVYERTLADRERVLGDDHPDTLTSRNSLALGYQSVGRIPEAITIYERTLADRERVLGGDHPDTLASREGLARAYGIAGQTAEATLMYERTLADRERVLGDDHPDTQDSRNGLAGAYSVTGRTAEAITLHERTLAYRERLLGDDHPSTLASRHNLAAANFAAGRTAEALQLHERTLADYERVLGTDSLDAAESRHALGVTYGEVRRTAESIKFLERALADYERLLGADHPEALLTRRNLAMSYMSARRTAESIKLLEEARAGCERALGADHPQTLLLRRDLASAYARGWQPAESISAYKQVLADCERVLGADDPVTKAMRRKVARLTLDGFPFLSLLLVVLAGILIGIDGVHLVTVAPALIGLMRAARWLLTGP